MTGQLRSLAPYARQQGRPFRAGWKQLAVCSWTSRWPDWSGLVIEFDGVTGSLTRRLERRSGSPAERRVRHSFGLTEGHEAGCSLATKMVKRCKGCRIKKSRISARDSDRQTKTFCRDQCKEVTRMASAELIGIESADHSWAATRVEARRLPRRCGEPGGLQGPVGWGSGAIQPSQLSGFARTT